MNKRNAVAKLNRRHAHRGAMLRNMATSLFEHERIITTRARAKALRSYSEKLITRARQAGVQSGEAHKLLHHKRELLKHVRNQDILKKLLEDIAPRFKDRAGGYTRIIHLPERQSDSSQMSILELVDRKEKVRRVRDRKTRAAGGEGQGPRDESRKREGKWYDRFRRKKKDTDFE
ncbi:MAG: 50S ribosomal protein L17 [Leptospirales bacterium]|nr:50S ribosomal protein L17 [Leptospirales bacterium]